MAKFIKTTTCDNDIQYINVDKISLIEPRKGDGTNKFATTYRITLDDGSYQDKVTIDKDTLHDLHIEG